jgi:hypothetical protein
VFDDKGGEDIGVLDDRDKEMGVFGAESADGRGKETGVFDAGRKGGSTRVASRREICEALRPLWRP